jgi:hypothetical protein
MPKTSHRKGWTSRESNPTLDHLLSARPSIFEISNNLFEIAAKRALVSDSNSDWSYLAFRAYGTVCSMTKYVVSMSL